MSLDIVRSVKNSLVDQGVNLSGPDGAFEITKRVAATLGLGVLSKTSGNNANGYATDIVMDHTGRIWDILIDAGGANEPSWSEGTPVDPARYKVSPYTLPVIDNTPAPPVAPAPPVSDPRIYDIVNMLSMMQDQLTHMATLLAQPLPPTPSYQGSIFGIKVVLRPV